MSHELPDIKNVEGVQFSISSPEDIRNHSVVEVTKFETYEKIQIVYKTNDNKKKLIAIDGLIDFEDIQLCYQKLDEIAEEISSLLPDLVTSGKSTFKHSGDPSGKSTVTDHNFENDNKDEIQVACYDYSKELGNDHLRVGIRLIEYRKFLLNYAY